MNVIEKNEGQKIDFEVISGSLVSFRGELFLDLSRYERDYDVTIDISENHFGMLMMGVSNRYVAQIEIPACEYEEVEIPEEEIDDDEEGSDRTKLVPKPFDLENVTLVLWGIE
ncbi:hypothetical protein AJ85_06620 [Alkalihalobacillus alcalophilus ATCC 27647 = CGMCC 1.3604]|uniref:Uncharacterized protein n=1 Tax=Alkalihalobacillus alcalophilus ATCC 27647 = CGMCC 1.3604 TaxID=1218173 RepID=A0A094YTS7_ALKAL|nr:hypothetical protein [Alkalihalobacillus alcalophilus]YP_009276855.1 hypothetical protein BH791_gp49 [Bacillus phage BalMu-1]AJA42427.1 hypothetical protein BalMu1_B49 [Bacillus phage BalMu-1]AJA42483.1 hypothetical protein BalMu1_A49 [Bacillus phage BalMu-1]KGA96877.1 hypothetical protein BALCAV_0213765 [Alkalihalobacillus alcalophilus ATCC 27647 = CGMCC 1.3604]MED1561169.1 hypothetical protein [Alkalihalobacillus alcalophilus]THG91158.1 hypothetical protein AJ85_06620 [Alkalihalobacillus